MQEFERDVMRLIGMEVGESPQRTVQRQQPRDETKPKPRPKKKQCNFDDEHLITELRNRGYEITARKTVEL